MSIRDEVKETIAHFTHVEEFTDELRAFKGLMRSLNTAEKNVRNVGKPKRRTRANPRTSEASRERARAEAEKAIEND